MNDKLVTLGPFVSSRRFGVPASVSEQILMSRAEDLWRAASSAVSKRSFGIFDDDDDPRHSPGSARMRAAA